jgi:hypothetical protein
MSYPVKRKNVDREAIAENGRLARGLGYLHCGKTEEKENSGTAEQALRTAAPSSVLTIGQPG